MKGDFVAFHSSARKVLTRRFSLLSKPGNKFSLSFGFLVLQG